MAQERMRALEREEREERRAQRQEELRKARAAPRRSSRCRSNNNNEKRQQQKHRQPEAAAGLRAKRARLPSKPPRAPVPTLVPERVPALTVFELKQALRRRQLPTGGRKAELVQRLQGALQGGKE